MKNKIKESGEEYSKKYNEINTYKYKKMREKWNFIYINEDENSMTYFFPDLDVD